MSDSATPYWLRAPVVPVLIGAWALVQTALTMTPSLEGAAFFDYAVLPARYAPGPEAYPSWLAAFAPLIAHAFLHGGWLHFGVNAIAFMQSGPFVAERLGLARFLTLYALSAVGGALAYIFMHPGGETPMVGASGAICGVFAAYFLSVRPTPQAALQDPQVRNAMVMFLLINVVLVAVLPLPIAWQAHLGGFIVGGLAYLALAPRRIQHGPWG